MSTSAFFWSFFEEIAGVGVSCLQLSWLEVVFARVQLDVVDVVHNKREQV